MGPADNRKLDIGSVVTNQESGTDFEVVGVKYREDPKDGEHIDFEYTIKLASEVQSQREADEEAIKALQDGLNDTETE